MLSDSEESWENHEATTAEQVSVVVVLLSAQLNPRGT